MTEERSVIIPERSETRRTISPYDLTASDNPGAIISYPLLNGKNYDEWALSFKTALCSRKKFGFLDGTISKPVEGSVDHDDWIPINALLVSWIKMSIHDSLRSSISHREVARDLWDSLKQRFSISNGPRLQQLKNEIATCKQNGQSVENYYGRLCKIWDCLSVLQPTCKCSCGRCTCDLVSQLDKDREEDRVQQFLYGVDDHLQSIRSSLVARTPLPRLEEAYNLLRQEEDIQSQAKKNTERLDVMALAVSTKLKTETWNKEDKGKLYCTHCKRNEHDSNHCFAIIGYPEWWGERNRGKNQPSSKKENMRWNGNNTTTRASANVATTVTGCATHQNQPLSIKDRDSVMGLSDAQWAKVVTLINAGNNNTSENMSGKSPMSNWILDTGASHHMTGNVDLLVATRSTAPVLIVLADGTQRLASVEGSVSLGDRLMLKSVYYVEGLKSDLISVGQLLVENRAVIQMAEEFLVIQDRSSRTVIGAGRRFGGTFQFAGLERAAAVSVKSQEDYKLWHSRFGHPSDVVLSKTCVVVVPSSIIADCKTCFQSKQTRDSFSLSSNIAAEIFDLIHCDVWGPYRILMCGDLTVFHLIPVLDIF